MSDYRIRPRESFSEELVPMLLEHSRDVTLNEISGLKQFTQLNAA